MILSIILALVLQGGAAQGPALSAPAQPWTITGRDAASALMNFCQRNGLTYKVEGPPLEGFVTINTEGLTVGEALLAIVDQFQPPRVRRIVDGVVIVSLESPLVSIDPEGKTLREVFASLAEQSGIAVVVDEAVDSKLPEGALQNKTLRSVLTVMTQGASPRLDLKAIDGGFLVLPMANRIDAEIEQDNGHPGMIDRIATNASGSLIGASDDAGWVILWDPAGKPLSHFRGRVVRDGFVDESTVLVVLRNTLYAIRSDAPARVVREFPKDIVDAAHAPLGGVVAAAAGDGSVYFIDARTGTDRFPSMRLREKKIGIALHPSGLQAALWIRGEDQSPRAKGLWIVDPATGKTVETRSMAGGAWDVAFSPRGEWIAASTYPGVVTLWSNVPGSSGRALSAPPAQGVRPESALAFSADGGRLYAGTDHGAVTVFDPSGAAPPKRLSVMGSGFISHSFAALAPLPGSIGLVAGLRTSAGDDKLGVYSPDGNLRRKLAGNSVRVERLEFSRDGRSLLVGEVAGFRVWNLGLTTSPVFGTARFWQTLPMPKTDPAQPVPETDKPLPVRVYGIGSVSAYEWLGNLAQPVPVSLTGPIGPVNGFAMSGDATTFAFQRDSNEIEIWDAYATTARMKIRVPEGWISGVGLSSDGAHLAVGVSGDKSAFLLWHLSSGSEPERVELKGWPSGRSIAMSRGTNLAAFELNGKAVLYDLIQSRILISEDGYHPKVSDNGAVFTYIRNRELQAVDVGRMRSLGVIARGVDDYWIQADNETVAVLTGDRSSATFLSFASKKAVTVRGVVGQFTSAAAAPQWDLFAAGGADGYVRLFDAKGQLKASLRGDGQEGYLVTTPSHHYVAAPATAGALRFKVGTKSIGYDQFDVRLNRPDLVMQSVGRSSEREVQVGHNAFVMRVTKLGLDPKALEGELHFPETPERLEAPPAEVTTEAVKFRYRLRDRLANLRSWTMVVNGVPELGPFGKGFPTKEREQPVEKTVRLNTGLNLIEVACMNEQGSVSMVDRYAVTYRPAKPVPRNLYIVSVGVSVSGSKDLDRLPYAKQDANDILYAFSGLGKTLVSRDGKRQPTKPKAPIFEEVHYVILRDKDATRAKILSVKPMLAKSKPDDVVVLFFAGHGVAPNQIYHFIAHGSDINRISETAVTYGEIESLVDSIPSRNKLILLDTCNAGDTDLEPLNEMLKKTKILAHDVIPHGVVKMGRGVATPMTETLQLMKQAFSNLERGTGAFVIAASTGGTAATESKKFPNGVFTRCVLDGVASMKADRAPRNGQITVRELANYVLEQVPIQSGKLQVGSVRRANAGTDFRIR